MPKEEWGVKRVCPETGKRFYDLNKSPVVSPYTGEVVEIETGNKSRTMVADKEDASNKPKEEAKVEGDEVLDDDDTSDVDLGDDVLGDDVLDDDDDDTVPLEEVADVAANDDDN
ncbi:MAG: TIGR02300 family protein [Marinosulfonomonas sp.]|nr:TIGR02300 family protein [Marinosulfonomonas sp.]